MWVLYDSAALLELLRINQFSKLKIFINNIYTSLEHVRLLLRSCCQVDYIIGTKLYYQVSEALFMHVRPIWNNCPSGFRSTLLSINPLASEDDNRLSFPQFSPVDFYADTDPLTSFCLRFIYPSVTWQKLRSTKQEVSKHTLENRKV